MKRTLALILAIITVLSFAACGNKDNSATTEAIAEEQTLGTTLKDYFVELAEDGTGIEEIANEMVAHPSILFNSMAMAVEPGFLPGFDTEITGFTKAMTFAPMISSIAFVGYVFETEDVDALIKTLEDNANLRWNVCVEAEEMIIEKSGNKVFFVMCPKSLESAE